MSPYPSMFRQLQGCIYKEEWEKVGQQRKKEPGGLEVGRDVTKPSRPAGA